VVGSKPISARRFFKFASPGPRPRLPRSDRTALQPDQEPAVAHRRARRGQWMGKSRLNKASQSASSLLKTVVTLKHQVGGPQAGRGGAGDSLQDLWGGGISALISRPRCTLRAGSHAAAAVPQSATQPDGRVEQRGAAARAKWRHATLRRPGALGEWLGGLQVAVAATQPRREPPGGARPLARQSMARDLGPRKPHPQPATRRPFATSLHCTLLSTPRGRAREGGCGGRLSTTASPLPPALPCRTSCCRVLAAAPST